jgi:hypothetical protein
MSDKGGWQWLRILTPILLALALWIVNDIRSNIVSLESKFDNFVISSNQQGLKNEARISKLEAIYDGTHRVLQVR